MESQGNKIRMQRWQTRCQALLKGVILWVQKLWGIIYRPRPAHRSLVFSYRTDSTDSSDCLPIHLNISVFCFLIFSTFYRTMLCIRGTSHWPVSVCLSVRHKSVFYQNEWTNRAGFWHVSFLPPVLHCVKKNSVISKIRAFPSGTLS